ncbi:MAG TPA: hypothetical protein P5555_16330 [Candidatus Paceibacterota bacterium]|nr:hypothetical protein [Verrucomicrobiota bacterium]HRZ46748.1 hypothetical protein [Candidatus Paceibacterota bacterium]
MALHLTRKDVAALISPSAITDKIRKNEKCLGLDKARVDFNARCVLYRAEAVFRILKSRGFDLSDRTR